MAEDEEITRLEAQLAGLSARARAMPLLCLGQLCWAAWWRAGPGLERSAGYLDKAIDALTEALGYFDPNDPERVRAALSLGSLHGARNGTHRRNSEDEAATIRLLDGATDTPGVPAVQRAMAKVTLAQVYASRAMRCMDNSAQELFELLRTGAPADAVADLDRALDHLRAALEMSPSPQFTKPVTSLVTIVEAFRPILVSLGIGGLGLDIGKMIDAMTKMQDLQKNGFGMNAPPTAIWDPGWLARVDPLDRPTAHMVVNEVPDDQPTSASAPAPTAALVDADVVRAELAKLVNDGSGIRAAVIDLLRRDEPPDWLDEFVALTTRVVDTAVPPTGTDHFLLAAALHLRGRRDTDGWAEEDATDTDAEAASESLCAAAGPVFAEDPDALPAVLFLATLMGDDALAAVAGQMADLTTILRVVDADALRFPAPVDSLWFDAAGCRIDPVCLADDIVVIGEPLVPGIDHDPVVRHASSLRQLVELSHREPPSATSEPVFLANPRGDREWTTIGTMLVRRTFYPRSQGFGRLAENADGIGTSDEIRAAVAESSVCQFGCGITMDGALELADGSELDCSTMTGDGLVILPPGHFLPLADVLLAAGFGGVIGWRRPLSDELAAVATFVLHAQLVDHGHVPAAAVRAVRRWFHQPDPTMLPTLLTRYTDGLDSAAEGWMSLAYQGR